MVSTLQMRLEMYLKCMVSRGCVAGMLARRADDEPPGHRGIPRLILRDRTSRKFFRHAMQPSLSRECETPWDPLSFPQEPFTLLSELRILDLDL